MRVSFTAGHPAHSLQTAKPCKKGGAFLGTLRSSSARETCRAKPTGALALPSGAVAPEGLLLLKQGTTQLALPND